MGEYPSFIAGARRPAAIRYGFAVLMVVASTLVSVLLRPASFQTPFLFFYPAPLLSLLFGGRGPAWLAAILSAVAADYYQLPPHGFDLSPTHLLADGFFILTFGSITWLAGRHRSWAASEIERQRELLNLANEPIGIRDKNDRLIFWNKGAERLFGWTSAEALGRDAYDLLKTKFPTSREAAKKELLEKGHWSGELVHQKKNGTAVAVVSYWTLKRDAHGEVESTLIVSHDLTEQRQLERAIKDGREDLRASEERLAAIIGSAMDAIITVDESQKIVVFNRAAENIFGAPVLQVLGKPLDMFIPEQLRQAHTAHIQHFAKTGETNRSMLSPGDLMADERTERSSQSRRRSHRTRSMGKSCLL